MDKSVRRPAYRKGKGNKRLDDGETRSGSPVWHLVAKSVSLPRPCVSVNTVSCLAIVSV
jgi:hypothetical protein